MCNPSDDCTLPNGRDEFEEIPVFDMSFHWYTFIVFFARVDAFQDTQA